MKLRLFAVRSVLAMSLMALSATLMAGPMSPDERRQMRQEMRDYWRQSPQEDRYRQRNDRGWQPMPQEDRQRMRDEMRGKRDGGYGGAYGSGGYGNAWGGQGNPYGGGNGGNRGGGRR